MRYEIDLREAIWGDQLEVHYQPVIELRILGAWCRSKLWRVGNTRRRVRSRRLSSSRSPKRPGLIVELGNWIMLKVCHDAMRMPKDAYHGRCQSVAVQFAKSNVVEAALFAMAGCRARCGTTGARDYRRHVLLEEEQEQNLAANYLRQLKDIGVSVIALDDFGVGYSSLAYLTAFPFDKVKIDKSFIDRLDRPETRAVIASIVQLHDLPGSIDRPWPREHVGNAGPARPRPITRPQVRPRLSVLKAGPGNRTEVRTREQRRQEQCSLMLGDFRIRAMRIASHRTNDEADALGRRLIALNRRAGA